MDSGFYAAVNGAKRIDLRLDVLANNLANANTTGFKEDRVSFDSYLTDVGPERFPLPNDSFMGLRGPGDVPFPYSNPASNAYRMTYPKATETVMDTSQGALQETGNSLDVAIEGEGYFVLETPEGRRYTRDGSFETNAVGELVNHEGFRVLGDGDAPLLIGNRPVTIARDGTISNVEGGNLGRLQRVGLPPEQMTKAGKNLFSAPQEAEQAVENNVGGIAQGYLEGSNVSAVVTMTRMIESHRAFNNYMQMIRALDDLDNKAANDVGRLQR